MNLLAAVRHTPQRTEQGGWRQALLLLCFIKSEDQSWSKSQETDLCLFKVEMIQSAASL